MEDLSSKNPSWFLPASKTLISALHSNAAQPQHSPLTIHQYNSLLRELEETKKKMHPDKLKQVTQKMMFASDDYQQDFLKECVLNQMKSYIQRESTRSKLKTSQFPGPMASQLSRAKLNLVRKNEYFITEKSDGVRCMMVTLFRADFPRWRVEYRDKGENRIAYFPLKVNIFLEIQHLNQNFGKTFQIKWIDGSVKTVMLQKTMVTSTRDPSKQAQRIEIVLIDPKTQQPLVGDEHKFLLNRQVGWQFSYVFDRTFQFYLCMEEFMFLTKRDRYQQLVILDGEIVWNLRDRRYNYTMYDIISLTVDAEEAPRFNIPPNALGKSAIAIVPCGAWNVKDKKDIMQSDICVPHHKFYKAMRIAPPRSLQLVVKHFYPKSEIQTVLSCIIKEPKTGKYLYKNYNMNDGFIFTPALANLYRFEPGTSNNLVKWKWPDKLTADFSARVTSRDENGQVTHINLSYQVFVRSRRKDPSYTGSQVLVKELDLRRQWHEMDEDTKKAINEHDSCIVECFFDDRFGDWLIHMVRKDKVKANSYGTVIYTLTNVMENITPEDLTKLCLGQDGESETGFKLDDPDFQRALISQQAYFTLRMDAENDVVFETCHPCEGLDQWDNFLIRFDELIGPNGETSSVLEDICYQNFDMGNLYPRIIFIASSGYWKIVDFGGKLEECSAVSALLSIEKMTQVALGQHRTRNFASSGGGGDGNSLKRDREPSDMPANGEQDFKRQRTE